MKTPEIPPNEVARLQTLRSFDILDTPQEERFDRLTRMARRLFDVPIALVSLVDKDRQWFKSRIGLPVSETPRDISFCGHSILGEEVFIIPDASSDERFQDNPLVIDKPNIRFYAGCPLRALNGTQIGTLCIIDDKPRDFSEADLSALTDLAAMAEQELAALQLAVLDELTEISNRRGFMTLVGYAICMCVRQKISASLVFFDLDKFKLINDTYGHSEGDRALVTFAKILHKTLRESDLVARIGGDEFAALLLDTPKASALDVILRLQARLDVYNDKSPHDYQIDFSFGVVDFDPKVHANVEALLADGDALMYECKQRKG
ncbi:diguanylate cyclase, putative [marine gamma proteobacterium HTCC2207]|uniref:Diguanylate cyclase, putative n=1 Tax=gamma proteobacterium HTCC2207 TaxID=314287 RepID=Q1YRB1_9GAMM|nr:diguanylate cyclase, putative [marine gamma proteobacterium HTCC2207] [gamma proteobacterium HTCC2207]